MPQAKLKHEAAACSVEERVRDKEALEAERLAAEAKVSENEAMVRPPLAPPGWLFAPLPACPPACLHRLRLWRG